MVVEYQEIRKEMEADGFNMEDEEFAEALEYARRKAKTAGKDESYIPYLLPDVIRERFTRRAINSFTFAVMEIEKIFKQEVNEHGTTDKRAISGKNPDRSYFGVDKAQGSVAARI